MEMSPEPNSKDEGLRLLKAGQMNEAVQELANAVKADPDDAEAHMLLGVAYNQKSDRLHAIHHLEESVRLQETPKALYNLGLAYENANRIDEAIRQYRVASELDPSYTKAGEALKRLQEAYNAAHPQPETPLQEAPAADATPGHGTGTAPGVTAVASPAAQPQVINGPNGRLYGGPPVFEDRRIKEQEAVEEAHKAMMKSGTIYGLVCGPLFALFIGMAGWRFGFVPHSAWSGLGMVIMVAVGLIYGGAVGLWIGHTCNGESAGMQAGAAVGAVAGLVLGLVNGAGVFCVAYMLFFLICSGIVGRMLGRVVDASIGQV